MEKTRKLIKNASYFFALLLIIWILGFDIHLEFGL
jgi:hypothetical protein